MNELEYFFKLNNFKNDDHIYYGTYKEHIVSVSFKASYVMVNISFAYPVDQSVAKQISKDLSVVKGEFRCMLVGAVSGGFVELTLYRENMLVDYFPVILDKTIDILNRNNVSYANVCAFCGKPIENDKTFIKVKKTVLGVHEKCISDAEKHAKDIKEKLNNKKKKNHHLTILLLSMIVSCLIIGLTFLIGFSELVIYFVSLTGIICYLILKSIFVKLKLPFNLTNLIIQLVFTTICLIGSIYIGYSSFLVHNIENLKYGEALIYFFKILKEVNLFSDTMLTLACGIIMIVINSLSDFRYLKSLDSSVKKLR